MSKRIIAVTSIVSDKFKVNANEVLDISKFTREQLKELHGLGAIRIEEVIDAPKLSDLDLSELKKPIEAKTDTQKTPVSDTEAVKVEPKADLPKAPEPKTPSTLKVPTKVNPPTVVKTTNPPVGRMTKENIAQTGANSSLNKGDSSGESKPK